MTWICPCSIIAVGLIILIFMVPIGLTLIDSCDILDDYTTSQGLVTHPKVIDKASGKLLDVCLNGIQIIYYLLFIIIRGWKFG